jgi:hypothetical protein
MLRVYSAGIWEISKEEKEGLCVGALKIGSFDNREDIGHRTHI